MSIRRSQSGRKAAARRATAPRKSYRVDDSSRPVAKESDSANVIGGQQHHDRRKQVRRRSIPELGIPLASTDWAKGTPTPASAHPSARPA